MTDKIGVFIDGGYLQKITEAFSDKSNLTVTVRPQIDFGKLSEVLCPPSKGERFRTYFYDCPPFQSNPPSDEERQRVANQEKFFHALKALPRFEVRLGRLNRITQKDGTYDYQQKGVDVLLSLDLAKLSWNKHISRAVILSGDSDFVPAVEEAKEAGVTVELVYCKTGSCRVHDRLFQICDERTEINADFIRNVKRGDHLKQNSSFVQRPDGKFYTP